MANYMYNFLCFGSITMKACFNTAVMFTLSFCVVRSQDKGG